MIEYNPQKYLVRDEIYLNECTNLINEFKAHIKNDSYFGYLFSKELIDKLSIILAKNNDDYFKYYKENQIKFNLLNEKISWEFIEPYTDFEFEIKPLLDQIEGFLSEKNYQKNNKAKDCIAKAEELLQSYIEKSRLIDSVIRNQFHNKLNNVKKEFKRDNLFSIMLCHDHVSELENILKDNEQKYKKYYLAVIKKLGQSKIEFEKSKSLISIKNCRIIQDQFSNADQIMKRHNYEAFDEAIEIIGTINLLLAEKCSEKKSEISDNIRCEVEKLKSTIWLDDWELIKNSVEKLIEEADKTGQLFKLNLDKFNIDQKSFEKKDPILQFIKKIEKNNPRNCAEIINQARNLINNAAYKKDLEKLEHNIITKTAFKDVKLKQHESTRRNIKYIVLSLLLVASVIIFSVNHVKNKEHFEMKGHKYLDIIETMVFSLKKSNSEININKIRSKILAPKEDLEIISISKDEVVIKYKSKIYKKAVRNN